MQDKRFSSQACVLSVPIVWWARVDGALLPDGWPRAARKAWVNVSPREALNCRTFETGGRGREKAERPPAVSLLRWIEVYASWAVCFLCASRWHKCTVGRILVCGRTNIPTWATGKKVIWILLCPVQPLLTRFNCYGVIISFIFLQPDRNLKKYSTPGIQ